MVRVREDRSVSSRACYLALGVTPDGDREVLGIWWQETEGARFWLAVLQRLHQRGVADVLIACLDGLTDFPETDRDGTGGAARAWSPRGSGYEGARTAMRAAPAARAQRRTAGIEARATISSMSRRDRRPAPRRRVSVPASPTERARSHKLGPAEPCLAPPQPRFRSATPPCPRTARIEWVRTEAERRFVPLELCQGTLSNNPTPDMHNVPLARTGGSKGTKPPFDPIPPQPPVDVRRRCRAGSPAARGTGRRAAEARRPAAGWVSGP